MLAFSFLLLTANAGFGQTLYYGNADNPWSGGNYWATGSQTGTATAWVAGDNAIFSGTPHTVTLSASQTATSINYNVSGYTLTTTNSTPTTLTGPITLANNVTMTFAPNYLSTAGGAITVGSVSGSGTAGVTITGDINNGTPTTTGSGHLVQFITGSTFSVPVTIAANGTLTSTNINTAGFACTGTSVATVSGNIVNNSAMPTNLGASGSGILTFSGVLSGTQDLHVCAGPNVGAATLILTNNNTYTGNTYMDGGKSAGETVQLGITNALPTTTNFQLGYTIPSGATSGSGGTLALNGHDQTLASIATNSSKYSGAIHNGANTNSTLTINGANSTVYAQGLLDKITAGAGTGTLALVRAGSGTTEFAASTNTNYTLGSSVNTFTGGTTITGGTIIVDAGVALCGPTGALSMAQTGTNNTSLQLNNTAQTISSLSSVFAATSGTLTQNIALASGTTLTVNQSTNTTFGDTAATLTATITGTGATLVKTGTGGLRLTTGGSGNTVGAITVTNGELRFNPISNVTMGSTVVSLNGGLLSTTAIASGRTLTFSTLGLTNSSTITLDSNNTNTVTFAATSGTWTSGKTLTINGWQGTPGNSGTKGQIFVGSSATGLLAADLSQITFVVGGSTYAAKQLSTGELVPQGNTDYYSASTGNLDATGTWSTNTNGAGGSNPSNFNTNYQAFHIANGNPGTISGTNTWTVSGTASTIALDQATDLTIGSSNPISGIINVGANRTLTIANSTLPTIGTIAATSTIEYLNITGLTTVATNTYGNLIFDNTSVTPSAGAQTIGLAGNLTLQNGASITSTPTNYVTLNIAGTGNQTITGNGNTLTLYQLKNNTNTTGNLTLAANTPITTLDNVVLVQNSNTNQFNDGGNTITVGNNLYMDGSSATGYSLTGTIVLNAATGTANVGNNSTNKGAIVAALKNVSINTTGAAGFYPVAGGGTITINGNLTIGSGVTALSFGQTSTSTFGNNINLGGNFTYSPTTDVIGTSQGNIGSINFNGTSAQSYTSGYTTSPGTNWGNWTVSNTAGTVTLSAPVKATLITTISAGANLALNGATSILNSAGSGSGLVNNGTISGTGEVKLTGSSAVPTISGTGTISNIEFAKSSPMPINSGSTQTITGGLIMTSNTLNVNGTLNIAPNAAISSIAATAGIAGTGNILLQSTVAGTGLIGTIATGGTVTTTVNTQRYVPGQRGYRLIGQPYTANIDLTQLSSSFDITGVSGVTSVCTGTSPSVFAYTPGTNPVYTAITTATGTYPAAASGNNHPNGILAFVRGTPGQDCSTQGTTTPSAVTFTTSGTINVGAITETVPAGGWNVISNPYPAPVDLSTLTQTGGNTLVYKVVNPAGQVIHTYTNGTAYQAPSSTIIPINGAVLAFNPAGNGDAVLSFAETNKSTGTQATNMFKTTSTYPTLELAVNYGNTTWDNWKLIMQPQTSNLAGDKGDVVKIANAQLDLYSLSADNAQLNWDARAADSINDGTIIRLGLRSVPQTTYTVTVAENSLPVNKTVYLHDKYTNSYTLADNGMNYAVTVTADAASQGDNRLELVFNNVNNTSVNTPGTQADVRIVPNPASNNIILTYTNGFGGDKHLSIINAVGQVVKTITTSNNAVTVFVGDLPNGMYLVKTTAGNNIITERFIKN